jgi:hypothetical protein
MMKNAITVLACAMLAAVMLSGCASTKVVGEWRSPELEKAGPYHKVFLAAIASEETLRREMEDSFQAALVSWNVSGVPSYGALPRTAEAGQEQLTKAVKESGADAALVFHLVKKESRIAMMPTYSAPTTLYGGYHAAWGDYYTANTAYEYDVITLEAKLFDVASGKLAWAVSTETTDPGKMKKEIAAYTKLICDQMVKAGLLSRSAR